MANAAKLEAVEGTTEEREPEASPAPRARPSRAKKVLPSLVAAFALVGGGVYLYGHGKETTDDAFVEAHVANVATRIQGQAVHVLVKDNQEVKEGDVLVELDDRDAKARLATAQADLASARANLAAVEAQLALTDRTVDANLRQAKGGISQASAMTGTSKAGIDQAKAAVAAAESRRSLAQVEKERSEKLYAEGAIGKAELDAHVASFDQAAAAVEQAEAQLASAQEGLTSAAGTIETAQGRLVAAQAGPQQLDVARAQVGVAKARVDQAQAALDQAELNVEYTKVKAPMHGVVSRRTVEPGQMVDPSRPLLSLTNLDDVWVVANFKEDQLESMHAGQSARVRIDTFGRRDFAAHLDSLAGGTGSRFALLPPDNASGNFTKVVQRVPVLVRLDGKPDVVLRPGMSAYVTIFTGK